MKTIQKRWMFFTLLVLFQLFIPASMIAEKEWILHAGEQHLFKTAPVDPYDIFRGRYVSLALEEDHVKKEKNVMYGKNQWVYVSLRKDQAGFSHWHRVFRQRPQETALHLKVSHENETEVFFELPFDRFYLDEISAPAAEKAYNNQSRNAHISVRIHWNKGILEQLFIENQPLKVYLNAQK